MFRFIPFLQYSSITRVFDRFLAWLQLGHAGAGSFVWAIILVCVSVEVTLFATDFVLWDGPNLRSLAYQYGGFWAGLLGDWRPNYSAQPWLMFITYSFLHGGFEHLIGNMIMVYILGRQLRVVSGQGGVIVCYVVATLGGALGFVFLHHSPLPMVGASGAVFGLAGGLLADDWMAHRRAGVWPWPVIRMLLFLTVLNAAMSVWFEGQLAWGAHVGGAIAGWLIVMTLQR